MPYPTLVLPPLAFPSSSLPPLPPLVNYFHSSQQCIPLGIAPSPTNNRSEVICSQPSFILVFSCFQSPPPQSVERRVVIHFLQRQSAELLQHLYIRWAELSNSTPLSFERDMSQTLVLSSCQVVKSLEDFLGLSCEDRNATCSSLRPMLCARYLMFRV